MIERILTEERRVRERFGLLGGFTTKQMLDNSVITEYRVPVCDVCGCMLTKPQTIICSNEDCGSKQCVNCSVKFESRNYCPDCAREIVRISKTQFIVIYGLACELNPRKIAKLSLLKEEEIFEAIDQLLEQEYLERKGLSVFTQYKLTPRALSIILTCEQIFRRESDVAYFMSEVSKLVDEKKD